VPVNLDPADFPGMRVAGTHGPSADMAEGRIAKQESNEIQA
jgi:hypothetical protein